MPPKPLPAPLDASGWRIGPAMSFVPMPKPPLEYIPKPELPFVCTAVDNPGGADNPGGGPVAVEKPGGAATLLPNPERGVVGVMADCGPMLELWPLRTPRGFLEKLSRMPPLMLL
jgi:hypothetical protein